ncbi:MAG: hypothetical protein U1D41_12890 [Nitrosomonas sp.]|uniref:hypothetical protein n=1 Tax=Nitrosomonas sp. TaxID=42353 RepID=UPI0027356ABA|nr:hypothetical protein [Nitrosomonas sp.]MDP3663734.1 hypothetical protein [Nitrosomonas sp.]MDZ4107025.1 hypothetical protein [Nitrosomonas sp.]
MTPQAALIELLERVGASQDNAVLVNDEELTQWPIAAVDAMKTQGLLTKTKPASSAICPGCEHECAMPIHIIPAKENLPARAFIACDKRNDISRVPVSFEKLTQWQCTIDSVCQFIAACLGLRRSNQLTDNSNLSNIGIAKGIKRSQMLGLKADGVLSLVAGNNRLPLIELIKYHDNAYSLDDAMIRQLVDTATTADYRYTPSNAKREARKLDTQAMYESWQKEYRVLKKKHPNMSDSWYSQQIAKMEIANGRSAETIRKNMKS